MSVVTALKAGRRGCADLYIDGTLIGAASADLVVRWTLHPGRELDENELPQVLHELAVESALADAGRFLQRRVRSRAEVERRLAENGRAADVAAVALDRLTAAGLVDDHEFARRYIADKRGLSGWGVVRIRRGLSQLGVTDDVVATALAEAGFDDESELDRALSLLRRKGAPQGPPEAARRRAYQTLLRRGFTAAVAMAAVRLWIEESSSQVPR